MVDSRSEQDAVVAMLQARMSSTRLPGKPLRVLGDKPLLQWVCERMKRSRRVDSVVVATSTAAADDRLAACCDRWRIPCYRGSETDVLGRFAAATADFDAGLIVRVNADNPLIDPHHVDALIDAALCSGAEYQSYRRGDGKPVMLTALSFFAETISRDGLRRADREITDPFEREHVTLGIYNRPELFDVRWLDVPECCNDSRLRFTVDTPSDLELLEHVFEVLADGAETATAEEIVRLTHDHPDWLEAMAALNVSNPKSSVPKPT